MAIPDYCDRFRFVADMNRDSAFTISDVLLYIKQLWLLPSNFVVDLLQNERDAASFFEIDCASGQGLGGAIVSCVAWLVIIFLVFGVLGSFAVHLDAIHQVFKKRAWTSSGANSLDSEVRARASVVFLVVLFFLMLAVPIVLGIAALVSRQSGIA